MHLIIKNKIPYCNHYKTISHHCLALLHFFIQRGRPGRRAFFSRVMHACMHSFTWARATRRTSTSAFDASRRRDDPVRACFSLETNDERDGTTSNNHL